VGGTPTARHQAATGCSVDVPGSGASFIAARRVGRSLKRLAARPGTPAHGREGTDGVIQEAYVQGISTRSVDDLVKALGMSCDTVPTRLSAVARWVPRISARPGCGPTPCAGTRPLLLAGCGCTRTSTVRQVNENGGFWARPGAARPGVDPVPFALPLPATAKPATAAVRGARSLPDADGAEQHRLGQPTQCPARDNGNPLASQVSMHELLCAPMACGTRARIRLALQKVLRTPCTAHPAGCTLHELQTGSREHVRQRAT